MNPAILHSLSLSIYVCISRSANTLDTVGKGMNLTILPLAMVSQSVEKGAVCYTDCISAEE